MKTNIESFHIIGITIRTNNENEQAAKDIPELWGKFYSENILEKIPFPEDRHAKNIFLEISGGITEKNVEKYSSLGADVISMGALTHSVMPIDFSLRFEG